MVSRKKRHGRDRGAAAVEFALVLPLLLMIMVGIMEFGWAFFIQSSVASAARVGVRNYAIHWTTDPAGAAAIGIATSSSTLPKTDGPGPAATITQKCVKPGDPATLVVTYKYHSLTGLLDGILGTNGLITLTGTGSMACGG